VLITYYEGYSLRGIGNAPFNAASPDCSASLKVFPAFPISSRDLFNQMIMHLAEAAKLQADPKYREIQPKSSDALDADVIWQYSAKPPSTLPYNKFCYRKRTKRGNTYRLCSKFPVDHWTNITSGSGNNTYRTVI